MNLSEKLQAWWDDLKAPQRAWVLESAAEISEDIAESLQRAGIVVVRAELADAPSPRIGYLLPAAVSDFVESKRRESLEP